MCVRALVRENVLACVEPHTDTYPSFLCPVSVDGGLQSTVFTEQHALFCRSPLGFPGR